MEVFILCIEDIATKKLNSPMSLLDKIEISPTALHYFEYESESSAYDTLEGFVEWVLSSKNAFHISPEFIVKGKIDKPTQYNSSVLLSVVVESFHSKTQHNLTICYIDHNLIGHSLVFQRIYTKTFDINDFDMNIVNNYSISPYSSLEKVQDEAKRVCAPKPSDSMTKDVRDLFKDII